MKKDLLKLGWKVLYGTMKKKGFTLIEMLISFFLVSTGLVGVLAFFNSNIQNQLDSKNEVIAAGLAQEGTELVRNIVDSNFLDGEPKKWYTNICGVDCDPVVPSNVCREIDHTSLIDRTCESKFAICFDGYRYYECGQSADPNETIFTRTIDIKGENVNGISELPSGVNLDTGDCLEVVSTINWQDRSTKSSDIICKPRQ